MRLQVSTTSADPALEQWSAWQEFVMGDYTARAFKWRLVMQSFNPKIAPQATELAITVDMPDRTAKVRGIGFRGIAYKIINTTGAIAPNMKKP